MQANRRREADEKYNDIGVAQRKQLRRNIVVKGLYTRSHGGEDLARELEEFFAKELDVRAKVTNATKLRPTMCIAQVDSAKEKMKILKNKHKMDGKGVTVFLAQLAQSPAYIQHQILMRADEERDKGNFVKVGRRELYINGTRFRWDQDEGKLVKVEEPVAEITDNPCFAHGILFCSEWRRIGRNNGRRR